MRKRYIVIDIGCLECHYATQYKGSYASVLDAKANHPTAVTEEEQAAKEWRGSSVIVIFDTRRK